MKNTYDVRVSTNYGWKYGVINTTLEFAREWAANFNDAMMASCRAAYEAGNGFKYEEAFVVEHNDNVPV